MSIRTRLAVLVLVLAAVGCSVSDAGNPVGQPGTSVAASSRASPPPSASPPTGLAAIEACDLLTVQEASSLGLSPQGSADKLGGLRICDWSTPGGDGISATIDEEDGIDGLNLSDASSVIDVMIGRHRVKRAVETSGPGYCNVYFAIGDTASVIVQALYLNDTPTACSVADQAAALIEPKLP